MKQYALVYNGKIVQQDYDLNRLAYSYYQYDNTYQEGDELMVVYSDNGINWFNIAPPPHHYKHGMPIFIFQNGILYYSENGKLCFFGRKIRIEEDLFFYNIYNGRKERIVLPLNQYFLVKVSKNYHKGSTHIPNWETNGLEWA